jgi:hypothetical protein
VRHVERTFLVHLATFLCEYLPWSSSFAKKKLRRGVNDEDSRGGSGGRTVRAGQREATEDIAASRLRRR